LRHRGYLQARKGVFNGSREILKLIVQSSIDLNRIPLLVGVTGHRDIAKEDEAPLRAAFAAVVRGLAETYRDTPLVVMSALAAGADILSAEEALSQGVAVIACLPMPPESYEEDFSPSERDRFRTVLAACASVTVVSTAAERQHGYVAAGRFLARYSNILLAFWDGAAGRGRGGTCDVVRERLHGAEAAPVYHILTPRTGSPKPATAFSLQERYPQSFDGDEFAERDFKAALDDLDAYNADLQEYGSIRSETASILRRLLDRTDAAANRLQKKTHFFLNLLFIGGFLGASAQILHSLPGKVAGILTTVVLYILARKYNYENRYQDYRALAEGLRVQEAWFGAGLSDDSVDASYLRMQQSELQWIKMALSCTYLLTRDEAAEAQGTPAEPVCREWIEGQWSFFKKQRAKQLARQSLVTLMRNITLGIGFLFFAGASLLQLVSLPSFPGHDGALAGLLTWTQEHLPLIQTAQTVPIAIAALVGSLLWQYAEKRSYGSNASRYQRMFVVFDRARERLRESGDNVEAARGIVRKLGQESLIEHADWLLVRRDHPISVAPAQENLLRAAAEAAGLRADRKKKAKARK
jgi:hypothetical protein